MDGWVLANLCNFYLNTFAMQSADKKRLPTNKTIARGNLGILSPR